MVVMSTTNVKATGSRKIESTFKRKEVKCNKYSMYSKQTNFVFVFSCFHTPFVATKSDAL